MKKEYLFYTDESHTISPVNEPLDSLQILGFETGETPDEALSALVMKNPWIAKSRFDLDRICHRITISDAFLCAVKTVSDYLWREKGTDYKGQDCLSSSSGSNEEERLTEDIFLSEKLIHDALL